MADANVPEVWKWIAGAFAGLWAMFVTMFGWNAKRVVEKVDRIEKEKADRHSTNYQFNRVSEQIQKHSEQIERHLRDDEQMHGKIFDRLNDVAIHVARIDERLANDDRRGTDKSGE